MNLTTIQSEGALISADLLSEIYSGEAVGQSTNDFELNGTIRLTDEIAACWSDAKAYWEASQHGLRKIREGLSGATVTREQWILPLLRTLGFEGIAFSKSAAQVGGQTYFISHRLRKGDNGLPIHVEGAFNDLDKRSPTGRPRLSPHALVQEYLNRTEHLWGIVTNGYKFRILRDSARLSRPTYLEFDLLQMMVGEHFAEFQLFYRIVHHTRWPADIDTAHECLLEQYYQEGIEAGGRVRERLRDGVEETLKIFGNGFLIHPNNDILRRKIADRKLSVMNYYRQLLRLIYRFLFLMVSEDRKLVGPDPENDTLCRIYDQYYSISRLREKVERPVNPEDRYWDLWEGIKQTFKLYCYNTFGKKMGVAALNGDLFSTTSMPDLEDACLYNKDFLHGFAHLSLFKVEKVTRRINYAHLDVEELGSVYESLLDYHPVIEGENGNLKFKLEYGTERKSTGSYYTRPELVNELIKSALVPVIEDRLKEAKTKEEKENTLLFLKVCDPAAGSGHFLLAAARCIGNELAKIRTGEAQPTPSQFRIAVRDVIQHCIYGVDLNPLAIDLCKVALWLEGHNKEMPLTFLDHRIRCGNSLIGLDTIERLVDGIPNDAFKPITDDDREVAKKIKATNRIYRQERESGQIPLLLNLRNKLEKDLHNFSNQSRELSKIMDDYAKQQEEYQKIHENRQWYHDWTAANIWTAAFFYPMKDLNDPGIPTDEKLLNYLQRSSAIHRQVIRHANSLAAKHHFFHWPLEFPEVVETGGFDCVVGNPPWERTALEDKEFFSGIDETIANESNTTRRKQLIEELKYKNNQLYKKYFLEKISTLLQAHFFSHSGLFQYGARGRLNTYGVFADLATKLVKESGILGIIVPTGIAIDAPMQNFWEYLVESQRLRSLIDFENKKPLFPGVHREQKFCLLTVLGRSSLKDHQIRVGFWLKDEDELNSSVRVYSLPLKDLEKISPNTGQPILSRTKYDFDLVRKIYDNSKIMTSQVDEPVATSWVTMTSSKYSRYYKSLNVLSGSSEGKLGIRMLNGKNYYPVLESKLINQNQYMYATYKDVSGDNRKKGNPRLLSEEEIRNLSRPEPRTWVDQEIVRELFESKSWKKDWILVIREVTNVNNERTAIATVVPTVGLVQPLNAVSCNDSWTATVVVGAINSLVCDYVAKQRFTGRHLNVTTFSQLPFPTEIGKEETLFISQRVVELIFIHPDLECFARDLKYRQKPFTWNKLRRRTLMAELDAYYAKLYGLTRDELCYILDPASVYGEDFPTETFRVLKEREIRKFGEYRTQRLVLEAWDRMFEGDSS